MKLSKRMADLLLATEPGAVVEKGPTRAALMRRGLVHNMEAWQDLAARLTPDGEQARLDLLAEREERS